MKDSKQQQKEVNPSTFSKVHPFSSVLFKSEAETIARNIMTILKRTGDNFRRLPWEEYKEERLKDGQFSEGEKQYFDKVIDYCEDAKSATLFSPSWKELVK